METEDVVSVKRRFARELAGLSRDELLNRQVAFEAAPAGRLVDWDLRLQQAICLGQALVQRFGPGGWQRPLEMRRKALAAQHLPA